MELQDAVRCIERRLLSQLEDKDSHTDLKDEAFNVKNKLHKTLRTSLGVVDFLRLVSEFGNREELEKYSCLATAREERLFTDTVSVTENNFSFEHPQMDIEDNLEMMFGSLSEIMEETTVWDPQSLVLHDDPLDHGTNDSIIRYPRTDPKLDLNYTEDNERDHYHADFTEDTGAIMSSRFARRQQFSNHQVKGHQRHPMKSMSFDESSPYDYVHSENEDFQQKLLHAQDPNLHPRFQILNEHETKSDTGQTKVKGHDSVQTAMHSLESSSKKAAPGGYRSMSRRLSAPPSLLIDTLNRRRLSALSILERANINTEGLNVTSDIESGMNEARLEWLRENVRKKVQRSISQDEVV
jgi:hypothetical protein